LQIRALAVNAYASGGMLEIHVSPCLVMMKILYVRMEEYEKEQNQHKIAIATVQVL